VEVDAVITLFTLFIFISSIVSNRVPVDIALFSAMVILIVSQVVTPSQALTGFSNPAIFIIACFYVVSAAVRESGALHWWVMKLLGDNKSLSIFLPRLMAPVAAISSVMSNTPVVAMFIPFLRDWADRHKLSLSKVLIPLSFASILGGLCTVIGTSTNIIVVGLLQTTPEANALNLFSPAVIGIPIIIFGILYFALFGDRLLPNRKIETVDSDISDPRQYAVSMKIESGGALSGKTISNSGILKLNYSLLSEIRTAGKIITSIRSNRTLKDNDILVFIGQPESVTELRQIPGLSTMDDQSSKMEAPTHSRALVEAILASNSSMVGKTVRRSMFRSRFGSVIVSVSRNGKQIKQDVAKIRLRAGDLLLIEAPHGFVRLYRHSRDFLLLSRLDGIMLPDTSKAAMTLGILFIYLALVLSGFLSLLAGSMLLVLLLGMTKCITLDQAQRSIDGRVLLAIGASISLGVAIQTTGLADLAVNAMMSVAGENLYLNLMILYVSTVLATELITNNAAAVLMFPLAQIMSINLDASLLPFAIIIMFGASSSFMTPMGYQTNLMVQGAGGYTVKDFFKVGFGLSLIVGIMVIAIVPLVWPFK
tara:strand:+ start:793 stop:2571 length:1779 start_codon:yes stop_codon:yes gene_type:complete